MRSKKEIKFKLTGWEIRLERHYLAYRSHSRGIAKGWVSALKWVLGEVGLGHDEMDMPDKKVNGLTKSEAKGKNNE